MPRPLFAAIVALGLSACAFGGGPEMPSTYGLYARNDDHLIRLDGNSEWEKETWANRSNLSPKSAFLLYDRALSAALPSEAIALQRVARVRYQVKATSTDSDVRRIDDWAVTDLPGLHVDLDFRPIEGEPEMIAAKPRGQLPAGLYSLKLKRQKSAVTSRFGVAWDEVDQTRYSEAHCVDRYVMNEKVSYKPCGGSIAGGLSLQDVKSTRVQLGDTPALLITGRVLNQADAPIPVPKLDALLRDASGAELKRLTFTADRELLAPGATADFRTEIEHAPREVSIVSVRLVPEAPEEITQ